MAKNKEDKSIAAYVLGIMSIVFAFFQPAPGIVLGIIGLVVNRRQTGVFAKKAKKYNIVGIVLSVIILIVSLIVAYYFANFTTFPIA